LTVSYPKLKA